ncbi:MAG: hypothetical protein ACR2GG_09005, partial [Gemmatimonadaceae bacterium]
KVRFCFPCGTAMRVARTRLDPAMRVANFTREAATAAFYTLASALLVNSEQLATLAPDCDRRRHLVEVTRRFAEA